MFEAYWVELWAKMRLVGKPYTKFVRLDIMFHFTIFENNKWQKYVTDGGVSQRFIFSAQ